MIMNLDDEIKELFFKMENPPVIIDDWENIAEILSLSFEWHGSKIDWSKTKNHKSKKLEGDYCNWVDIIRSFINREVIFNEVNDSFDIYYINDSSLDFALYLKGEQLWDLIPCLIENVPQHHYFFDKIKKWCFVISSEGYLDFGVSIKNEVI